jgi:hypothetical protein
MDLLHGLIIICLSGFIISILVYIINYNTLISKISVIFNVIFIIGLLLCMYIIYHNTTIDNTNSHCFNLKLIDGSSTIECFDLSNKQMKNLHIHSNDGSYWLITSSNTKSIFIQYQIKLKPAVIDFHIIKQDIIKN